jgi:hypothetical protein
MNDATITTSKKTELLRKATDGIGQRIAEVGVQVSFRYLARIVPIVFLAILSLTHLQGWAIGMKKVLKFSTHDFGILCYGGITNLNLVYGGSGHNLCIKSPGREKLPSDETRVPGFLSGSYPTFAGPVEMEWNARDGTHLTHTIDLDEVFKDRVVLHTADSARIYEAKPISGGEPTIIVEVNDRTVSVYMKVSLQLVRADPTDTGRDRSTHFTRAYSKTL